jgi:alkylhydroperoxidase family enzyme
MARLPYLEPDQVAPEYRDMLKRNTNLHKLMVNSPDMARSFNNVGNFIRFKSKLDPRLRELAILQVGYLAKSPYEYSHHVKIGREFGVTDDDIRAIGEETAGRPTKLDALAKTVLRAAREMTNGLAMSDATFAELEKALGREQVIDLTLAISFYNAVVRLLATLQIDVEPEYQRYLEEHPLPR